jgi:hypothetical protein
MTMEIGGINGMGGGVEVLDGVDGDGDGLDGVRRKVYLVDRLDYIMDLRSCFGRMEVRLGRLDLSK